jgi:hypothetical protein
MSHKIVNVAQLEADLTMIADSIRYKVATSEKLTFPAGFKNAIDRISTSGESGGGSSAEWIGDGNTHIWITLTEGRTSPPGLCVGVEGTVTVDWGDGTTPDTLTGTDIYTEMYTPNHNYENPGDYVITLTIDGFIKTTGAIFEHSGALLDDLNHVYRNAVKKVEIGNGVLYIGNSAFEECYSLAHVTISGDVAVIGDRAFRDCYSLTSVTIPRSVEYIYDSAFANCYSLASATIQNGLCDDKYMSIFNNCRALTSVTLPDDAPLIPQGMFSGCYSLASVAIPGSVGLIGYHAFYNCYGVRYYDFTNHTAVPTLDPDNTFYGIASDCEIRVPAELYNDWIAARNWKTYANYIVAV